ncbi:MAG: type II toxin-antitoxin system VapC family toxin [Verrucomicrobia bacterium]|nr:type II toxin-antitoxin system VapC family toxin [Verrucomicrobiota bacterium]
MKATVYIESSVISYLTARPSKNALQAERQRLTRLWWRKLRPRFDCYVSDTVIEEISDGELAMAKKRLTAVRAIPRLAASEPAADLTEEILKRGFLPSKAATDAAHIAIAATSGMNFLLTWNCTHIANAHVERQVAKICIAHEYEFPVICTPEQLMVV